MPVTSKSAKKLTLVSLVLSVILFVITFLIGQWSGFFSITAISWLVLSSVLVWFVLAIQFHQRSLAEQEKLDLSQLSGAKDASTIFQAEREHSESLAVAGHRLELLEKWFIPIFSALIAIYQVGIGLYLLKILSVPAEIETKQSLLCATAMIVTAFITFLISRYATGISTQPQWKPLRAGGSIFLCIAILCFSLAIGLALVQFKIYVVENAIKWIIPALLVIVGAETALNVVFDIYRPRLKGQYHRSAFDSRLLGVINEPGGIFRTAASTVDYQFGFKVSQTWFYKLLEKAIVPLILFAAVTLYLLSCITVIAPDEQAIIEHFGNPLDKSGNVRLIGPGLVFKWPWPVDITRKHAVKKIREINIGFVPKLDSKTGEPAHEPLLWGKGHHKKEYNLLVASESSLAQQGAVPISLVKANVPIQYRVKDIYKFLYNYNEPEQLLQAICYQQLAKLGASASIEVDNPDAISKSLLGAGRTEAKRILTERIQAAADKTGLGVEIVFVGIQGMHPPPEVAEDYQKVISSVQKKQALVLDAQAYKNGILSSFAGSVEEADKLYKLVTAYQKAKDQNNTEQIRQLEQDLDEAFANAKGDIFQILRTAQSYAFEKATLSEATGKRFAGQLKAHRAAPQIYKRQLRLAMFEQAMENIRKYLVVADEKDTQIFIINVEEKLTPNLYEIGGFQESEEK